MYQIFDISLDSDLHLPELPQGDARDVVIEIKSGENSKRVQIEPEYFHEWQDTDGEISMLSAEIDDRYLFRFPELVDILISIPGDTVCYFPEPNIPEETIRHLILDQIIPRILGQHGHLVLHASAVKQTDGNVIVFLGGTSWGKSTIASSYLENGEELITDDCLLIKFIDDNIYCVPNYSGLRLYPDSSKALFDSDKQFTPVAHYSTKGRLVLHDIKSKTSGPVQIEAIFLLTNPGKETTNEILVEKIQGAEEIMAIVEQTFLLDIEDKHMITKQFSNATKVCETLPAIYRLSYPRKYEMLSEVRNTVKNITANIG